MTIDRLARLAIAAAAITYAIGNALFIRHLKH